MKIIEKFKNKKVKKTIVYEVIKYYSQDIMVSRGFTDDEILDLWKQNKIKEITDPEPYETIFGNQRTGESFII